MSEKEDIIGSPNHYTWIPGIQPIDLAEWLPYNLGAVVKYVTRCGRKDAAIQDLQKAAWYLNREIERLTKQQERNEQST